MNRIGVVSGRCPPTPFASPVNHRAYCQIHGYTYIHANWPTGHRNRYLNKIEYLRYYAPLFDFVFWIDDDAFFLDLDRSLDDLLPPAGHFLSICASPAHKQLHTYVSSGQFVLRCDPRGLQFLDDVITVDLEDVRRWWTPELGFFSNGDQDAIVYLLRTKYADEYTRHPATAFNSRPEEVLTMGAWNDVFVLHFTGKPETKAEEHDRVRAYLRRPDSLLPQPLHDEIDPADPRPATPRSGWRRLVGAAKRRLRPAYWSRTG